MAESQWTIDTLKEFFEARLDAENSARESAVDLLKARLDASDEALKLQADANRVHFDSLNHEGQRLLAANAASVPRELFDNDKKAGEEWRRSIEDRLGKALATDTFDAYKETTQRATNVQTGLRQGVGLTGQTALGVLQAAGVATAILLAAVALFRPTPQAPVSYQPPAQIVAPLK